MQGNQMDFEKLIVENDRKRCKEHIKLLPLHKQVFFCGDDNPSLRRLRRLPKHKHWDGMADQFVLSDGIP